MDPLDPTSIVCRCCLKQQNNFLDFNAKYDKIHRLKDIFEKITGISSQELGSFTKCCHKCHQSLTLAYKFRQESITSHNFLVKSLKVEEDSPFNKSEEKEENITMIVEAKNIENDKIDFPQQESLCNLLEITSHDKFLNSAVRDQSNQIEKKKPRCHHCSKAFVRKQNLQIHLIRNHFPNLKAHFCKDCGKKYETKQILKEHIRRKHIASTSFKCDLCDATFKTRNDLLQHEFSHIDERPHLCDKCSAIFKTFSSLIEHQKTKKCAKKANQLGQKKDWSCDICQKKFTTRNYLQIHKKWTHKEERDYVCTTCGKEFKNPRNLREHILHHTGQLIKCEHCPKEYTTMNKLKKHITCVHSGPERPYKCHLCTSEFFLNNGLSRHLRMSHKIFNTEDQRKYPKVLD